MKRTILLVILLMVMIGATSAFGIPVMKQIEYEKKVCLLFPSTHHLKFSLHDAEENGNLIWQEEKNLTTKICSIKTYLGDTESLEGVDFTQQMWVQVEKLKPNGLTWNVIGSRDRLSASPYSIWSMSGSVLDSGAISGQLSVCEGNIPRYLVYIPGRSFSAITSTAGTFQLDYVPPGTYDLIIEVQRPTSGFPTVVNVRVEVRAGQVTQVPLFLTNLASDSNNCGTCGNVCPNIPNGRLGCINGQCIGIGCLCISWNHCWTDCNDNPDDGCEISTWNDVNNCGTCGNVCPQGHSCVEGQCQ